MKPSTNCKLIRASVLASGLLLAATLNAASDPKTLEGSGTTYGTSSGEDLAKLDNGPIAAAGGYTQDGLAAMNAEQLDVIYAGLTSGPIPDGFYRGKVVVPPDRGLEVVKPILGIGVSTAMIKKLAEQIWSGKFFNREKRLLQNQINLVGGSVLQLPIPRAVNDANMIFPAKVFCGQSLFDSRRESVIIDYKYGEPDWPADLKSSDPATEAQRATLNWVAGPKGLMIRDEIRMVNPGLYLGRAYLQGVFGLYFILKYAPESGGQDPQALVQQFGDECWIGHQRQQQLGKKQSDYVNN